MTSNLPTLINYIQTKTLDWTSPHISSTNLFMWNVTSGVKNVRFFQENIISSYNQEKFFSILIITGAEETSATSSDTSMIYKAVEALLADFNVSVPLTSKFFLGFLTWENLSTDIEFQSWKSKYLSLSKKDKVKLLKSINKTKEAKELEKSKTGNLKNSDEIISIVTIAKKNPSVMKITYVAEGIELSCVVILSVQILGILTSYDSRTFASLGDILKPNKIKGFFKGIGSGCSRLVGCVSIIAKGDDLDNNDD